MNSPGLGEMRYWLRQAATWEKKVVAPTGAQSKARNKDGDFDVTIIPGGNKRF